ncbi:hypothetical protein ZIOFF_049921 [Zingiber officinale]|uniref:Uncharacterized protein n=1 Tax=Zingiber officinale TaxID=94328 RepID=A0A8J5KR06_ZINOF|nr:hypothetical protein ZIOFF_049921 [Zingiber officinale]
MPTCPGCTIQSSSSSPRTPTSCPPSSSSLSLPAPFSSLPLSFPPSPSLPATSPL